MIFTSMNCRLDFSYFKLETRLWTAFAPRRDPVSVGTGLQTSSLGFGDLVWHEMTSTEDT